MPIFTDISRFVNPGGLINQVNDVLPGGVRTGIGGIQTAVDPGQLGTYYYLTAGEAIQRYGNVLFSGLYQYVQCVGTSTAPARGLAAFWSALPTSYTNSLQNYIATAIPTPSTAENEAFFAGIWLNAVTPGNYGWIQVGGVATVQYKSTATGAIGDVISLDTTPTNTFVDLAQTATTAALLKLMVGTAITAPANSALGQILMRFGALTF